jgi:hypothetical protein
MRRLARLHAQKECVIAAALAKAVGASYEDHIAVRRDGYRFGEITAIASQRLSQTRLPSTASSLRSKASFAKPLPDGPWNPRRTARRTIRAIAR